jgi:predicted RNase H-like nuclease (RuvC/YqgF family)
LVDTDRQIIETQQQIDAITNEQTRIRENMKTVDRQSAYYTRLVTKLNDQETQIEKLRDTLDQLRKTQSDQRAEIENYLNSTSVD